MNDKNKNDFNIICFLILTIGIIGLSSLLYLEKKISYYPLYKIIIPREEKNYIMFDLDCKKKISFKLNQDMMIISNYIKKCNYNLARIITDKIAYEVVSQCKKEHISIEIILGIIQTESNFNPMAVSPKKARGLMQVLDKQYEGNNIDKAKLHDIAYNIEYGIKILKTKLKISKGNMSKALYYYVGRDKTYSGKVYKNISNFFNYKCQF